MRTLRHSADGPSVDIPMFHHSDWLFFLLIIVPLSDSAPFHRKVNTPINSTLKAPVTFSPCQLPFWPISPGVVLTSSTVKDELGVMSVLKWLRVELSHAGSYTRDEELEVSEK